MAIKRLLPELRDDTIKDILFSLNTIQKRSESLLDFVENYRKLTRVPKPVMQQVQLKPWLASIENLMREELMRESISLAIELEDENQALNLDPTLIEQVLINLLRNSIHALEGRLDKRIEIKSYHDESATIIEVSDNGKGIPEKELKDIFIPFFSTKKDGSGIGLSLSKQIMSLHGGRIRVRSKVARGNFVLFDLQERLRFEVRSCSSLGRKLTCSFGGRQRGLVTAIQVISGETRPVCTLLSKC